MRVRCGAMRVQKREQIGSWCPPVCLFRGHGRLDVLNWERRAVALWGGQWEGEAETLDAERAVKSGSGTVQTQALLGLLESFTNRRSWCGGVLLLGSAIGRARRTGDGITALVPLRPLVSHAHCHHNHHLRPLSQGYSPPA